MRSLLEEALVWGILSVFALLVGRLLRSDDPWWVDERKRLDVALERERQDPVVRSDVERILRRQMP